MMIPQILISLKWLCYAVLLFYILRILVLITFGTSKKDNHRLRGSMALAYAIFASVFIFNSIAIIPLIVGRIVEGILASQTYKYLWYSIFVYLTIGSVFSAFICNFSRSLWMLKSLENGIFEAVPDWSRLSKPIKKRVIEFLPRSFAAIIFIRLEIELEKLSHFSLLDQVKVMYSGGNPESDFSMPGKIGLLLYCSLVLWWISGKQIAQKKMPKSQLFFYLSGLIISLFVFIYGRPNIDQEISLFISISLILALSASMFMLFIVFKDIYLYIKGISFTRISNYSN